MCCTSVGSHLIMGATDITVSMPVRWLDGQINRKWGNSTAGQQGSQVKTFWKIREHMTLQCLPALKLVRRDTQTGGGAW